MVTQQDFQGVSILSQKSPVQTEARSGPVKGLRTWPATLTIWNGAPGLASALLSVN
jgi:hypothetical protein